MPVLAFGISSRFDGSAPTSRSSRNRSRSELTSPSSRKAVHRLQELPALLRRDVGVARGNRAGDAVVDVLVEDLEGEALERCRDGRDLRQDVDAVAVVLDHPLDSAHLALDPMEPLDERLFVGSVAIGVRAHASPSRGLWNRRKRRLLVTTKTLENAIA